MDDLVTGLRRLLGPRTSLRWRSARAAFLAFAKAEGAYRRRTGQAFTVAVGSYRMRVPDDMRWAFLGGVYYERTLTRWLRHIVAQTPRQVFYDIGANYGYYALLAAPHVEKVYAFEPVSASRTTLVGNLESNSVDNVCVEAIALSDHRGDAEIRLFSSSGNDSLFDVPLAPRVRPTGTETVALDTLDDLVYRQGFPVPGVVKMDIEGSELFALRGARRLLREHRPTMTIEFNEDTFGKAGYTPQEVAAELRGAGYDLYQIPDKPGNADPRPLRENAEQAANVLAIDPVRAEAFFESLRIADLPRGR